MKKLLFIFLIMSIAFCGMVYANDYEVISSDEVIEISELENRSYHTILLPYPILPFLFSFEESGNFVLSPLKDIAKEYSGYYTQTGFTFTAHCEYDFGNLSGEYDFKGTSILDIFICGICTGPPTDGNIGYAAVFFGVLKLI